MIFCASTFNLSSDSCRCISSRTCFMLIIYHGLYGSTNCCCCISHGQVNGRGRFSTLHSFETPQSIFMKLKIYNLRPGHDPASKISGGYVDVGGLGK